MSVESTFASYTGSITFESGFIDGKLPKTQGEVENYFFGRLYSIKPDLRKQYLHQARSIVHGVLDRISEMTRSGRSEGDIDREAKSSFLQFRSVEDQFLSGNASYRQMKAESSNAFNKMEAKIKCAALPFDDFVHPDEMYSDPSYLQTKKDAEESLALARMIGGDSDFMRPDEMFRGPFYIQTKADTERNIAVVRMIGGAIESVAEAIGYGIEAVCDAQLYQGAKEDAQHILGQLGLVQLSEAVDSVYYREPMIAPQNREPPFDCDDWSIDREDSLFDKGFEMIQHVPFME